ncbi:hypothetical protein BDY21DRAFT_77145 [Lineolata rhizophorae]|uniref:Uncharacterized protein n=1 Tax=Lineolata rhizophorae TaxID=578093 RepID=A0A6A6NUT1_9PEZI|nr:hypothetical protein BDY21DRAFT_77145 [Lineolata rhizophorae]
MAWLGRTGCGWVGMCGSGGWDERFERVGIGWADRGLFPFLFIYFFFLRYSDMFSSWLPATASVTGRLAVLDVKCVSCLFFFFNTNIRFRLVLSGLWCPFKFPCFLSGFVSRKSRAAR